MFTTYTYQDYLAAEDKIALLCKAIEKFKASAEFVRALNASSYFRGENPTIARKTILRARKIETRGTDGRRHVRAGTEDVVGNRIGSSFLFRFVTQQNQFLLSEGVSLPEETKKRLGADFDHLLSRLGECALLHGVSYGYWNADHLEIIEMARAAGSGFFPLLDEMTGELMLGVQFWQLGAKRPMFLRLFEQDGVTILRVSGKQVDVVREKTAYVRTLRRDALGDTLDVERQGYGRLPLIPLYANQEGKSELTPAIQAKIDAYDNILSDFADNLARANDVYWVLNNFSGTTEDIAEMLEEISRIKAVANLSDGSGSGATAEPHTIEVPYAARQAALNLLVNAVRYSAAGTQVHLSLDVHGDGVLLRIVDQGDGMSAQQIQKLNSGTQSAPTARVAVDAAGSLNVGLHMVREVLRQHDGWLCFVSDGEKGTEVRVYLPVAH